MSENIPIEIEKDADYAVVFADGVLLQVKGNVSRLIFYRENLEVDETNADFDRTKKFTKLMFEVRLSYQNLRRLATMADNAENMLSASQRAMYGLGYTNPLADQWEVLQQRVTRAVVDTNRALSEKEDRATREMFNQLVKEQEAVNEEMRKRVAAQQQQQSGPPRQSDETREPPIAEKQ